jgi:molybdenum cofactor synthesis domain-containing protein
MLRVAILTVSDSCAAGTREDKSGPVIREILPVNEFEVVQTAVVPDDREAIIGKLLYFCDQGTYDIVLTTGGTGLGPRDVTPESTISICDRVVPGLGEVMRAEGIKHTRNAMLSRSIAGIRKKTLIINLPGSPVAVRESLVVIVGVLPHAIKMIAGGGH